MESPAPAGGAGLRVCNQCGNGRSRGYSPGHLHERGGHGCSVDGEISIQVNNDAEIEQVDPN